MQMDKVTKKEAKNVEPKRTKPTEKVNRTDREAESREEVLKTKEWKPSSLLPEFKKQPGWAYRWIRVSLLNVADNINVSSKMREGWEPVKHSEHPEIKLVTDPNSSFKDAVEIGGLLLCKAPQEMVDQRNAYYKQRTADQTEAIENNYMNQNDPRMPKFSDGRQTTSFGKGNK